MKNLLLASLIVGVCVSAAMAAPTGKVLADGQSMITAGDAGDCARNVCTRIERSGDMVYNYAIVKGEVKKVLVTQIPRDAVVSSTVIGWGGTNKSVSGSASIPLVQTYQDVHTSATTIPKPPTSNYTGSLSTQQQFLAGGTIIVITTIFFYVNGACVDIQVNESRYLPPSTR